MPRPQPTLRIRAIRPGWRRLRVDYELSNPTGAPLYLFNLISEGRGAPRGWLRRRAVSSRLAQTCLDRPDGVHFLHGIVPPPGGPDVSAYGPLRPLATRVAAGGRARVRFCAPVPLRAFSVYEDSPPAGGPATPVTVVRARLSVDLLLDEDRFFAEEHPEVRGAWVVNGAPIRRLEAEAPLPAPCALVQAPGFRGF